MTPVTAEALHILRIIYLLNQEKPGDRTGSYSRTTTTSSWLFERFTAPDTPFVVSITIVDAVASEQDLC